MAAEILKTNEALAEVLGVADAAKLLGVSRWALYESCNRNDIPHRRLGKRILFSRAALMVWLEGASSRDGKR